MQSKYDSFYDILSQEETPQDQVVENTCVNILNSEITCEESCQPRQEIFSIEDHNDVVSVEVHDSSLLGKHKLHENLNIQVLL